MTEPTATEIPVEGTPDQPVSVQGKGVVYLKGEIEIYPHLRLPHLDHGPIKAYEAKNRDGAAAFAVICEKSLVPQMEWAHKYAAMTTTHLPRLVGAGVVEWVDGIDRCVFVYDNRMGKPISVGRNPMALGLKPELVLNTIFRNLVELLHKTAENSFALGNIRATNIFDGGSETFETALLGESLSLPAGYDQPVLYETIERAVADPIGRGAPILQDDLYALGVTIAILLRTHNPQEGLTDEQIVQEKIDIGSFNCLTNQDRFPGPVVELLKGLLNDSEASRWDFNDLAVWMEGRRVGAKQGGAPTILKASRPLDFAQKKFLRPQLLALALPKDSVAAMPTIENGDLFLWLNRSLQNKEYEDRFEKSVEEAKKSAGGSNYPDRLATFVAAALAPGYPINYKNIKFFPSGFGNMLVEAMARKKDLAAYVDLIQSNIVSFWNTENPDGRLTYGESATRLESCKMYIKQTSVGYGIERCIYYLSPMAPCLSDKLTNFYVRSPEDYLMAMEKMAQTKARPEWFLDRHIIAFLLARDKVVIEPYLADLNAEERYRQRHAVLRMLAAIQKRSKLPPCPGVSVWISELLGVVIDRYHDREKRKHLKNSLDKIKDKGDLSRISELLDDYDDLQADMKSYLQAMKNFQILKKEYHDLDHALQTNKSFGVETGKQAATLVSGAIAGFIILIYLVISFAVTG